MDLLTNQPQLLQEWINTATEDSDGLLYGLMSAWPYDLASSSRAGAAAPGRLPGKLPQRDLPTVHQCYTRRSSTAKGAAPGCPLEAFT